MMKKSFAVLNSIESQILAPYAQRHGGGAALFACDDEELRCLATHGFMRSAELHPICQDKNIIGFVQAQNSSDLAALQSQLAPLLLGDFALQERSLRWLVDAKEIAPAVADWIGIYWKESFLLEKKTSKDLLLGAYFGEATEHTRIPLNKGLCGLALTEERVVNVDDVSKEDRHIACSLKTRSELVIPLHNRRGKFVAELDIDSYKQSAFTPALQKQWEVFAETFFLVL